MFSQKNRRSIRVSTSRVYLAGNKSFLTRYFHSLLPYTRRSGYRGRSGALLAV